jgi:hypothetical protein
MSEIIQKNDKIYLDGEFVGWCFHTLSDLAKTKIFKYSQLIGGHLIEGQFILTTKIESIDTRCFIDDKGYFHYCDQIILDYVKYDPAQRVQFFTNERIWDTGKLIILFQETRIVLLSPLNIERCAIRKK